MKDQLLLIALFLLKTTHIFQKFPYNAIKICLIYVKTILSFRTIPNKFYVHIYI